MIEVQGVISVDIEMEGKLCAHRMAGAIRAILAALLGLMNCL